MEITLYCPNATKRFAQKVKRIVEAEFGTLLPLPAAFLREQFPLYPTVVKGARGVDEVTVHVGTRKITVTDHEHHYPGYTVRLEGSKRGWGQAGPRRAWRSPDDKDLPRVLVDIIYQAIEHQA